MRIDETGTELDELGLHRVVHTSRKALIVWTGTFQRTLLLEIVKTYIISIVCTTAAKIHVVVLTDTRLEHFFEPIGIRIVHEVVFTVLTHAVSTGQGSIGISCCLSQIVAVLVSVHHVVCTTGNLIDTEVTFVVNL